MTFKRKIKNYSKETNKMSIKDLVGKKMTKNVKFLGEDVKIKKLSVADVTAIQKMSEETNEEDDQFELLRFVVRAAVEDAEELEDSDFEQFPIDELSKLSEAIIEYSGVNRKAK